jgi:hypothetical protein
VGTTTTPNLGLIKPDLLESAANWPAQNLANCTVLDDTLVGLEDTYAPSWTASSVNPAVGNGEIQGKYITFFDKLVLVWIKLRVGSTTTLGSGTYSFSLPVAPNALIEEGQALGDAWLLDAGTVANRASGVVIKNTGSTVAIRTEAGTGNWSDSGPFVLASGDSVQALLWYPL